MKIFLVILFVGLSLTAQAELVGIKAVSIFREQKFQGLEVKCTEELGFGCLAVQVYYQDRPITRSIVETDFYLDTDDFGKKLDIEFGDKVSCRGLNPIKWEARTHVNIGYCANRDVAILLGKSFLFLQYPGQTATEFYPGKREEFKQGLKRIDLTFTYVRAIMFHDRETLGSEKQAKKIAQFLEKEYPL